MFLNRAFQENYFSKIARFYCWCNLCKKLYRNCSICW